MQLVIEILVSETDVKFSLKNGNIVFLRKSNKSSVKRGVIICESDTQTHYIFFNGFLIPLSEICDHENGNYHEIYVTDELPSSYRNIIKGLDLKNLLIERLNKI